MTWKKDPRRIKAQAAAWRIHQDLAITEPSEINVENIAMIRGIYVATGKAPGADAWLVSGDGLGIVRVSDGIRERGRRRFAIAHELGHWELHRDQSQVGMLCHAADLRDYTNSPTEIEANVFAAEFLMPTRHFQAACRGRQPDLAIIKDLAEQYDTSLTATAMRYVDLGPQTCLVVFSEEGRVRSWRSRPGNGDLWINKAQAISQESMAWQCWMNGVTESDPVEVPGTAWFLNSRDAEDLSVTEHSMRLGGYNMVMSLLWIM